jgi:hypothetical protein
VRVCRVCRVCRVDALYEMSTEEKALVWKYRGYVRSQRPYSLAKVLLAAPSTNRQMIAAIHALLANWPPLPPVHALEVRTSHLTSLSCGRSNNTRRVSCVRVLCAACQCSCWERDTWTRRCGGMR